jgi:hypothetical protein
MLKSSIHLPDCRPLAAAIHITGQLFGKRRQINETGSTALYKVTDMNLDPHLRLDRRTASISLKPLLLFVDGSRHFLWMAIHTQTDKVSGG